MNKEQEYKYHEKLMKKYINNSYINNIVYNWGSNVDGVFHKLNSNISPLESLFINNLIKFYKPKKVLEIGMAHGMSSMIILNALNKYNTDENKILYSVDPFQDTQWFNIGLNNITQVLKTLNNNKIKHKWVKKLSDDAFEQFSDEMFDMILIDGAHDEPTVIRDINNTKRVLKTNGIMILDDVLHKGVKAAMKKVLDNDMNYTRVYIKKKNMNPKLFKELNPLTMYAYRKIT